MSFKKKMKQHIDLTLDSYVPNPYEKSTIATVQKKKKLPLWAKIALPIIGVGTACAIIVPIATGPKGLERLMQKLNNCYVDMTGVTAVGVYSASEDKGNNPISAVKSIQKLRKPVLEDLEDENENENTEGNVEENEEEEFVINEDDPWELDYDGNPINDSVLVVLTEDNKIKEVVYEQTNARGQIRQSTLGYVSHMFVSNNFTFVEYSKWSPNGDDDYSFYAEQFIENTQMGCCHEFWQTLVIHNETGAIYALNNAAAYLEEISGTTQYSFYGQPYKQDYFSMSLLYGPHVTGFARFYYDPENGIYFKNVMEDLKEENGELYKHYCNVVSVYQDKYEQEFILESHGPGPLKVGKGLDQLTEHLIFNKQFFFTEENEILAGSDQRMYTITDGKLMVFGDNFTLSPVEHDIDVILKGMHPNEYSSYVIENTSKVYEYKDSYLFSVFGEAYKIGDDGTIGQPNILQGNFPTYTSSSFAYKGKILAIVNAKDDSPQGGYGASDGEFVKIEFNVKSDIPSATVSKFMDIEDFETFWGSRLVVRVKTKNEVMDDYYDKSYWIEVSDAGVIELHEMWEQVLEPLKAWDEYY